MSEQPVTENIVSFGEATTEGRRLGAPSRPRRSLLEARVRDAQVASAARAHAWRGEVEARLLARRAARLRDDGLGHPTFDQAQRLHRELSERLHDEIADGATVHRRVPWIVRPLPWTVAVLDGSLLYAFCADIFDARLGELSRQGLAALSLAVLGSAVAFAWLALTGLRLRDYRSSLGEIHWKVTGSFTRALTAGSVVITVTLAILMDLRVVDQAQQAAGLYLSPEQVPLLGWGFAVLSACSNLTVVAVHALDGSALTAQTLQVGRLLLSAEGREERARRGAWRRVGRRVGRAAPPEPAERTGTDPDVAA